MKWSGNILRSVFKQPQSLPLFLAPGGIPSEEAVPSWQIRRCRAVLVPVGDFICVEANCWNVWKLPDLEPDSGPG